MKDNKKYNAVEDNSKSGCCGSGQKTIVENEFVIEKETIIIDGTEVEPQSASEIFYI